MSPRRCFAQLQAAVRDLVISHVNVCASRLDWRLVLAAFLIVFAASGCGSVGTHVRHVGRGEKIETIYVQHNERVLMEDCTNEIVQQMRELGFRVERENGKRPPQARFWLTYTANWNWDMAMYLRYFKAELRRDDEVIGTAEYGASHIWEKFGRTAEKIRPLLREMMRKVEREAATGGD